MSDTNQSAENHVRKRLARRNFLLVTAAAGAGLVGAVTVGGKASRFLTTSGAKEATHFPGVPATSRVIVVRNERVLANGKDLVPDEMERMLASGMSSLFDSQKPVVAWQNLFKPDDVVGIKVNCIAGPELSSHPHLVAAIVSKLQQAGLPPENIIVWDRTSRELTRAGYSVNTGRQGVKCYGTDAIGYESKASSRGSFHGQLSKILTRQITALINVPILKNHGGAGVTIAMKNHYGSIQNPKSHHKNLCDPYIADLNSVDDIKAKTRLIICDATRATCNGGPAYNPAFAWHYSGLLFSRDPVALDTIGTKIIDERREQVGLPTLKDVGRYPRQLLSAAERGLGNTDPARIDMREILL